MFTVSSDAVLCKDAQRFYKANTVHCVFLIPFCCLLHHVRRFLSIAHFARDPMQSVLFVSPFSSLHDLSMNHRSFDGTLKATSDSPLLPCIPMGQELFFPVIETGMSNLANVSLQIP